MGIIKLAELSNLVVDIVCSLVYILIIETGVMEMAISRGQYGMGSRITNEYFAVGAYKQDGTCYMNIVAAPTRGMAHSQMQRKYPGCRIELIEIDRERYEDEMREHNYWLKHAGSARGPEPIC